ncbi:phage protease [Roseospira goensis]|uniref:Phage I-like protein n=1 Tax=Roseospira goensis TaxID=391922 RepID=A0A7W6WLV4_9PROT|nr:phage protease [Roseospira goensis]MBB4287791.1 phage I-like protein [Roseospira goensis]
MTAASAQTDETVTASRPEAVGRALCLELPAPGADGAAPEWIMLIPAGADLSARDGRRWTNPDPDAVVAETRALGRDLVIDWEHASELRGRAGERTPAAGWIQDVERRNDGSIWGRVEWTADGARDVAGRAYRYFSPAFDFGRQTRRIKRIVGGGLVHFPNFQMPALAREEDPRPMTDVIPASVTRALGLADGADERAVCAAIDRLRADVTRATAAAEQPPLERFVPRADHDMVLQRATAAETRLAEVEATGHQEKVDAAIKGALEAGKITPASEGYHRATCRTAEGLAAFETYVQAAPKVVADGLTGKAPPAQAAGGQLTDEERATCRQLGLTEAQYIATRDGAPQTKEA